MTFEISIDLIVQIMLYLMTATFFYFTTKWIITGKCNGYYFSIRKSGDFVTICIFDGFGILFLLMALSVGGIIRLV